MTQTQPLQVLSKEVSSQLPIFEILGNVIPDKMVSPETKKTGAKVIFWLAICAFIYGFYLALPSLIAFATMSVWFIAFAFFLAFLIGASPGIIRSLHKMGRIVGFKSEKAIAEKFSIESMQLQLQDIRKARTEVRERITQVQGVVINFITSAQTHEDERGKKIELLRKKANQSAAYDQEAIKFKEEGKIPKANQATRDANETRNSATLLKSEAEADELLSKQYAQYANEFGNALETFKDHESSLKIYEGKLKTSVDIVEKKLEATKMMREATDGIAEVMGVEDKWQFNAAWQAAQAQISDNIAHTRRNLDFVSESRLNRIETSTSQKELEAFINQIDLKAIKRVSVQEISHPSHELSSEEKVDKSFNLLD